MLTAVRNNPAHARPATAVAATLLAPQAQPISSKTAARPCTPKTSTSIAIREGTVGFGPYAIGMLDSGAAAPAPTYSRCVTIRP